MPHRNLGRLLTDLGQRPLDTARVWFGLPWVVSSGAFGGRRGGRLAAARSRGSVGSVPSIYGRSGLGFRQTLAPRAPICAKDAACEGLLSIGRQHRPETLKAACGKHRRRRRQLSSNSEPGAKISKTPPPGLRVAPGATPLIDLLRWSSLELGPKSFPVRLSPPGAIA